MVDVETRIDPGDCSDDLIPCIAIRGVCAVQIWEVDWRWVGKRLIEEICITTFCIDGVDMFHECIVEAKDSRKVVQRCHGRGCYVLVLNPDMRRWGKLTVYHHQIFIDGRIVDLNTLQIEILRIILFDESLRDVRNILSRITLASDVHLVPFHTKSFNEPLPEIVELI